ncbi:hypothetical protein EVG20_g818 [Dentipellis fragilis]|uniref:C2H2-type domain-containing protein n=1 Tax=Dentipellis fragilis TaxID=205917 RepID=A0A4Y9ZC98_9AGAM|nr:hypothetical protein EVG20_g818 [Dentipellis fragilis]
MIYAQRHLHQSLRANGTTHARDVRPLCSSFRRNMKLLALQTCGPTSLDEEGLTSVQLAFINPPHPIPTWTLCYHINSSMSYLNQPYAPPPFEGDQPEPAQQITLTPDDIAYLSDLGLHLQYPQDNAGSFEFADLRSNHAPQDSEFFALTHRPEEDIYCVPPQVQSTGLYGHQSTYDTEIYQDNQSFAHAHTVPSVPSMPIQAQQGSALYDDAYSIPRAVWLSSSGSGYPTAAPAPSTTLNHSGMASVNDFIFPPTVTPSLYASHSGPYHAAPPSRDIMNSYALSQVAPMALDPQTPSMSQLLAHQQSMPGYDGASSRVQSRRLTRERVAPVVSRTARSGQQGNQTLKNNKHRTREIDLGDEYITGQYSQGCLLVPPRGPSVPVAATSASSAKVRRAAKGKASTKRQPRALAMPLPRGMPPIQEIFVDSKMKYVCPWKGCSMSCARRRETKRHYWLHLDNRPRWECILCNRKYTRSDNAGRHYRDTHSDDEERMKADIVQVDGDMNEATAEGT